MKSALMLAPLAAVAALAGLTNTAAAQPGLDANAPAQPTPQVATQPEFDTTGSAQPTPQVAAQPEFDTTGSAQPTPQVATQPEFDTTARPPMRDTTVSVELAGFSERGLIIDAERDLPDLHISIDAGLVLRASATGDYSSRTLGIGGEVRYWFKRRAIWTRAPRGSAVGWYTGARVDLARTSLEMDGMSLGRERQFATSVLFGYRFAPWRGLEVRPYTGLAIRREWDASDRLAAWTKGGLVFGFAVGWSW